MNKETIGIEIDAWGPLKQNGNTYTNAYGKVIDSTINVENLKVPFRGYSIFQEYFDKQIESLKELIQFLSKTHSIPMDGLNKTLNFEFCNYDKPGIYSHSNFRKDKSDVYPCSKLIKMLKTL
jgi:hypothetical protein